MSSGLKNRMLMHEGDTVYGEQAGDVKEAEKLAGIILEYETKIHELYEELSRPKWVMYRSRYFIMDEISPTSLCIKGKVFNTSHFWSRNRRNVSTGFTITWFHSKKCFVYIQDGVGYTIFHDSAAARQILAGKMALCPVDWFSSKRLQSLHALIRLYVEQTTKMYAFVTAFMEERKKFHVVLNNYKRPFTLIKGYNATTGHGCYVILASNYYFYYELTRKGTVHQLLYAETVNGLLEKILHAT
jgi:hypothetical protein